MDTHIETRRHFINWYYQCKIYMCYSKEILALTVVLRTCVTYVQMDSACGGDIIALEIGNHRAI